jgi:hypothetical protein
MKTRYSRLIGHDAGQSTTAPVALLAKRETALAMAVETSLLPRQVR